MRVNNVPNNVIKSLVDGIVICEERGAGGFAMLSKEETVTGVTNLIRKSSDTFIKEEGQILETNKKIDELVKAISTTTQDTTASGQASGKVWEQLCTPQYQNLVDSHMLRIQTFLVYRNPIANKTAPSTAKTIGDILADFSMPQEKRSQLYKSLHRKYVNQIVNEVKKRLNAS